MKEELSGKVANVYLYHNTRTNTFIYFNSGRIIFKNTWKIWIQYNQMNSNMRLRQRQSSVITNAFFFFNIRTNNYFCAQLGFILKDWVKCKKTYKYRQETKGLNITNEQQDDLYRRALKQTLRIKHNTLRSARPWLRVGVHWSATASSGLTLFV